MAEAFFKKYIPKGFEVISAGTKPSSEVNPIVLQAMNEISIDMQNQTPKTITQQIISEYEKTVNMECIEKESCPALFLNDVLNWQIHVPKGKPIEQIREIRDQIKVKVMLLIKYLEDNN